MSVSKHMFVTYYELTWLPSAMDSLELSWSQPKLNSPSTLGFHLLTGCCFARQQATGTSRFSISQTVTASGPAAASRVPSGEKAVLKAWLLSVVDSRRTQLNGSLASHIRAWPDNEQVARSVLGNDVPFVSEFAAVFTRKSRSLGYRSGYSWTCRLIESFGCKMPR